MPKIIMFGTGGVGCYYTYILSRSPNTSVTTVCRSNFEAMRDRGITLHSKILGDELHVKPDRVVQSCEEASALGQYDYVVVTAKALPGIAEKIEPVSSRTSIVMLQNGIEIEEQYAAMYPGVPIVSGAVYLPVTQIEPAVVRHGEMERVELGGFPAEDVGSRDKAQVFADLLRAGGANAEFHEDVQARRWAKLLVNASWNPICALTRRRDVHFLHSSLDANHNELDDDSLSATGFVKGVMNEVLLIAQMAGYGNEVNEATIDWQMSRAKARGLENAIEPSMLGDARHGRRLEVEAILGNTVRRARGLKVATPKLDVLYMLLRALDEAMSANG